MLTANAENKAILVDAINGLVAEGGTNFYAALGSAFDTMDKTIAAELHNNCNSAVLFLKMRRWRNMTSGKKLKKALSKTLSL